MKKIEIDDELYAYIASNTQIIGESPSAILRRLLNLPAWYERKKSESFALVAEKTALDEACKEVRGVKKAVKNSLKKTEKEVVDSNSVEFIATHLSHLLSSSAFKSETKNVKKFLMILSALYFTAKNSFSEAVMQTKGSERLYFSRNREEILQLGSGVRVRKIPDTPFYVNSNNNSERKGRILVKILTKMKMPKDLIEKVRREFY